MGMYRNLSKLSLDFLCSMPISISAHLRTTTPQDQPDALRKSESENPSAGLLWGALGHLSPGSRRCAEQNGPDESEVRAEWKEFIGGATVCKSLQKCRAGGKNSSQVLWRQKPHVELSKPRTPETVELVHDMFLATRFFEDWSVWTREGKHTHTFLAFIDEIPPFFRCGPVKMTRPSTSHQTS